MPQYQNSRARDVRAANDASKAKQSNKTLDPFDRLALAGNAAMAGELSASMEPDGASMDYWERYSILQDGCPALSPEQVQMLAEGQDGQFMPPELADQWNRYEGDSRVFHGGEAGMIHKDRELGLYNECFYDAQGGLIRQDDPTNPYGAMGGSPDSVYFNPKEFSRTPQSMTDAVAHTLTDPGGIAQLGLAGYCDSQRYIEDQGGEAHVLAPGCEVLEATVGVDAAQARIAETFSEENLGGDLVAVPGALGKAANGGEGVMGWLGSLLYRDPDTPFLEILAADAGKVAEAGEPWQTGGAGQRGLSQLLEWVGGD